jgi:hypothetical protein
MPFDPATLADDASYEGHLDQEPMSDVIAAVLRARCTGRLSVRDSHGTNSLFFMQGRPVGVVLAEVLHPLGQLLLEEGRIDSAQFVKAQRLIGDGERLPGQVFMEIGAISGEELKTMLAAQARKKAQRFAALTGLPFEFSKGLTFLTGFKSSPMEGPPLVFHAVGAGMNATSREAFLASLGEKLVRATSTQLGAPLQSFGFGRAEERFLQRLGEPHTLKALDQFGTLPRDDIAALLRYLHVIGNLELLDPLQARPAAPPPAALPGHPATPPAAKPVPPKAAPSQPRSATPNPETPSGPSPNAAVKSTGAREMGDRRAEDTTLPSVLVDYDALGIGPKKH